MDSKSISRKGVGVQVPASAPHTGTTSDELSRALLCVLLHELANTTQYLSALNALLTDDAAACAAPGRIDGLTSAAREVDELGWLLGLVANASGADLLLERRCADGIAPLVRRTIDCVRRAGGDMVAGPARWPALRADARADGWRTPWVCGQWLYAVGRSSSARGRVHWELRLDAPRPGIVCQAPPSPSIERCARELADLDPRLEFELAAGTCSLWLPAGVLAAGGAP